MELFRNKAFLLTTILSFILVIIAIYVENIWLLILPVFVIGLTAALYYPWFYGILVLITVALSVPLSYFYQNLSFDLFLPSEILIMGLLILLIFMFLNKYNFDKTLLKHPITIAILVYLFWMLITSMTSSMPLVSMKHFLARLWFIAAFYFFAFELFKQKPARINHWVILFAISTTIVIVFALGRQYYYGIGIKKIAYWAAHPFYKDHTSYGALLAMFLPFLIGFSFSGLFTKWKRVSLGLLTLIFLAATVFSYTRAAWVSLLGALCVYVVIRLRIKLYVWAVLFVVMSILGVVLSNHVVFHLEQNKQESSVEISKHVRSISNISNDISNLERINRWKCAYRMFEEKPVFGFGPGTYMFNYAPFQMYADKTPISTNSGDLGNAHSEYLGVLSESGILGFITFLAIVVLTSITAIRLYYRLDEPMLKLWVMGAYIGLVTYFLHGIVNNFLDTDKISLPFWSFMAIIVFVDIQNQATRKTPVPKA
jgi:O-antigen ligase